MNCEMAHSTVHGYFDGELDAVRAAEFERHLESCPECQAALEQMESLRTQLREPDLYERASPRFRNRIRTQLGLADGEAQVPTMWLRRSSLVPAIAILSVAVGFAIALVLIQGRAGASRITAELIDAHVRSLQPGHLTDVQSTDQHTVKPWFDGKLDFVPPVSDYSERGFPLLGGRLDIIDGHSVAALVYGRRKHIINLFVWSTRDRQPLAEESGTRQGYQWITWHSGEMQFCLASDVSATDLQELKTLIPR